MFNRVVSWFSCGVTSAVALKLTMERYTGQVPIVPMYIDTGSEDPDNLRFLHDVEQWLGVEIQIIKSADYTDTFDVYRKTGYLVGVWGAKCSHELKKKVRQRFEDVAGDLQVFGFDAAERSRAAHFTRNNPEILTWYPLIEAELTKDDCHTILLNAGVRRPATYDLGFNNANCLLRGCVKGGAGYWNHYRKVYPDRFAEMAKLEREIGAAICKTYVNGERVAIYLDELPPDMGRYDAEPAFQCGLFCGTA